MLVKCQFLRMGVACDLESLKSSTKTWLIQVTLVKCCDNLKVVLGLKKNKAVFSKV